MDTPSQKIKVDPEELNAKDFLISPSDYFKPRNKKSKNGRPVFNNKDEVEVLTKLQCAFSVGATAKGACCFADISIYSFYRYCKKYPEFRNKVELLQTAPLFLAEVALYNSIVAGDMKIIRWYVERRCPEKYSPNVAIQYQLSHRDSQIEYLKNLLLKNNISFSI